MATAVSVLLVSVAAVGDATFVVSFTASWAAVVAMVRVEVTKLESLANSSDKNRFRKEWVEQWQDEFRV